MNKSILLIIIFTCFSCKTGKFDGNIYSRITKKGYSGLEYGFSDMGSRNLRIHFLKDSILKISNRTDNGHNHHLSNFDRIYYYRSPKIGEIIIGELIQNNNKIGINGNYLKPYQNDLDFDQKGNHLFPNVEGDTIRFSSDFKKMQIREFNFSMQ